jgi:hypothetical protein
LRWPCVPPIIACRGLRTDERHYSIAMAGEKTKPAVGVWLVAWWAAEGREIERGRALRLQRLEVAGRDDPFAAIIRAKADKRTGASGLASCGTLQRTSRIPSLFNNS